MEYSATYKNTSAQAFAHDQDVNQETIRKAVNYHPSLWGDCFLNYTCDDEGILAKKQKQAEKLKAKVREDLLATSANVLVQLKFIDSLQRLGVAYHFETEIEEAIKNVFEKDHHDYDYGDDDLHIIALYFRILREHGYNISSDIFNRFKDERDNFKENLVTNVEGLLSLYEAAHMRFHGEDILEEALAFATTHLRSATDQANSVVAAQITHALRNPIRRSLPRVEARHYMSIYQENPWHNEVLLMFAKLDFNLLQSMHKKELQELSLWWKDLDFATKLPFARNRLVECYFWMLGVFFKPQYLLGRRISTKMIAITSVIDDIYDVYGTLDELELLTDAIQRWDINSMNQLPKYMQICYQALLDIYKEIEHEMEKEGNTYRVYYAKQAIKDLIRAYFEEAKWCDKNYIPTMEEYMNVALVTSGYTMLPVTSFLGMGKVATKEVFDWAFSGPKIFVASQIIGRLTDDIVGHEFEHERDHVASAVECYMKQHGVTKQQAQDELKKQIENAWKDINEEFRRPTVMPAPLLILLLNYSRVIYVLYKEEDNYTHVGEPAKDGITSLLIDPVPM